jgi:hypothetical protein
VSGASDGSAHGFAGVPPGVYRSLGSSPIAGSLEPDGSAVADDSDVAVGVGL